MAQAEEVETVRVEPDADRLERLNLSPEVGGQPFFTATSGAGRAERGASLPLEDLGRFPFTSRVELERDQRRTPLLGTNLTFPWMSITRSIAPPGRRALRFSGPTRGPAGSGSSNGARSCSGWPGVDSIGPGAPCRRRGAAAPLPGRAPFTAEPVHPDLGAWGALPSTSSRRSDRAWCTKAPCAWAALLLPLPRRRRRHRARGQTGEDELRLARRLKAGGSAPCHWAYGS